MKNKEMIGTEMSSLQKYFKCGKKSSQWVPLTKSTTIKKCVSIMLIPTRYFQLLKIQKEK